MVIPVICLDGTLEKNAEAKEFYDIMYNKKLTDQEVDELLAKSTLKEANK